MSAAQDNADAVAANALKPKRVMSDGVSVEAHSLPDQIEAVNHAANVAAAHGRRGGLVIHKLRPPGSI